MNVENMKPRPDARAGLWCSFLLPSALFSRVYTYQYESDILTSLFIFSIALLVIQFYNFRPQTRDNNITALTVKPLFNLVNIIATLLTIVALHFCANWSVVLLTVPVTIFIFLRVFCTLLVKCPYSFTMGEAAIVSQAVSIFGFAVVLTVSESFLNAERTMVTESTLFLQVLMVGCGIMIILYNHPLLHSPVMFVITFIVVASLTAVLWILCLQQNPFTWLFYICINSWKRVFLILSMFLLVFISICFVSWCVANSYLVQGTILIRKFFHIVIMIIYIPGIIFDIEFLYLASGCTFSILIVLEIVRLVKLPILSPAIENAFCQFIDEKDCGLFILTHIYLHIGCSCPLWLYPPEHGLHLSHWSGIVSVGLGDMVAALIGISVGKHRWPGSKKTVEGTLAAIFAQIVALAAILYFGPQSYNLINVLIIMFASVSTSLIEAKTTQVDNLILPLWMFPVLSFIHQ